MCGHIQELLGKMIDKAPISPKHHAVLAFEHVEQDPLTVKLLHD